MQSVFSDRYLADLCLGSNAHLLARYIHTCLFNGVMEDEYSMRLMETKERSYLLCETSRGL